MQGRLCLQGPHTGSLPSVREGIFTLWTLAQAAKQAEAGQRQGEARRCRDMWGRAALAAVIAGRTSANWARAVGAGGFVRCAGRHLLLPRGGQAGAAQPGGAAGTPASPSSSPAVSPLSPHPPALPRPTHPLATWACSKCGLRERGARRLPCGEGLASRPPGPEQKFQGLFAKAEERALLLCTWSKWSWGPHWPGSAISLQCPSPKLVGPGLPTPLHDSL